MKTFALISLNILFFVSCTNNTSRKIKIDENTIAVGNISEDTIYNGLIKFYDISSDKITGEFHYTTGVLNGEAKEYYNNGKVLAERSYENNKQNGYETIYDETGSLKARQYYYYDILCGPIEEYESGKIIKYSFYSLSNQLLFNLNFNSIKGKKITDVDSVFYFYHANQYSFSDLAKNKYLNKEYFIYTPNPPGYNFNYSIVLIDKNYKIDSIVQKLDNQKPWSIFSTSLNQDSSTKLAIQLNIQDPIVGKITMLKTLN